MIDSSDTTCRWLVELSNQLRRMRYLGFRVAIDVYHNSVFQPSLWRTGARIHSFKCQVSAPWDNIQNYSVFTATITTYDIKYIRNL